jgi:Uma2 family endonuclease
VAAQPQTPLTPEQYLEIERASNFKSEYYNGAMYAMSGASWPHVLITGNFARELGNALKNRPCMVGASDLRVRVSPRGLYAYPDVVVICDSPMFADAAGDVLLNPLLLIEVLSPSTEAYDRGFKSQQYRKLESLQEYALASQTEPRIEVFRRQPGDHWLLTEFAGLEATCHFDSIGAAIPLSEIYSKVLFPASPLNVPGAAVSE